MCALVAVAVAAHALFLLGVSKPASVFSAYTLASFCGLLLIAILPLAAAILLAVERSRSVFFALVTLLLALAYQITLGMPTAVTMRLYCLRPSLEREVQRLRAGLAPVDWNERDLRSDNGFTNSLSPMGFIDGGLTGADWGGFVFDPVAADTPGSGAIEKAMTSPMRVFGARLTRAIRLGRGWYYCWFS